LKILDCNSNNITQLDNLPRVLEELSCTDNKLTQLDNLPPNLIELDCRFNPLIYDFKPTLANIRKYNAGIPVASS